MRCGVAQLARRLARRRQVFRQLAPVVTADSPVVRFAPRDPPSFQVTSSQWALLVRTGDGSTPRALAMALGRSVFGTTIEVYRLLALGMLVVPGHAAAITSGQPAPRPADCWRRPPRPSAIPGCVAWSATAPWPRWPRTPGRA